MNSTFYYLVKPKNDRYNNTNKIGDKELVLNTEIFNHQYISRQGIVVGLPKEIETPIQVGDEVIVHHNVFRRWHDVRGKERNSASYVQEDLYRIDTEQVFAYKRDEWTALPNYTFVKPAGTLIGEVVYSDKYEKGTIVGYRPAAEYEFNIDEEKLYRVRTDFITMVYEYKGEEKQNNRSWLQGG